MLIHNPCCFIKNAADIIQDCFSNEKKHPILGTTIPMNDIVSSGYGRQYFLGNGDLDIKCFPKKRINFCKIVKDKMTDKGVHVLADICCQGSSQGNFMISVFIRFRNFGKIQITGLHNLKRNILQIYFENSDYIGIKQLVQVCVG